jgi:hypothetical protein
MKLTSYWTESAPALQAQQVLLANGAARHGGYGSFGWLRRRIVPIGSFIIVTEPAIPGHFGPPWFLSAWARTSG